MTDAQDKPTNVHDTRDAESHSRELASQSSAAQVDVPKASVGRRGYRFVNWARTYTCRPALFFEPETEEQVIEVGNEDMSDNACYLFFMARSFVAHGLKVKRVALSALDILHLILLVRPII
jgi:hypothetical protein